MNKVTQSAATPSVYYIYMDVEIDSGTSRLHAFTEQNIPEDCNGYLYISVDTEVDAEEVSMTIRGGGNDWDAYANYNVTKITNVVASGFPSKYVIYFNY